MKQESSEYTKTLTLGKKALKLDEMWLDWFRDTGVLTVEDTKGNPIVFIRGKYIKGKVSSLLKDYLRLESENEARLEKLNKQMENELNKSGQRIREKYKKMRDEG